jgi:hypothetical protein
MTLGGALGSASDGATLAGASLAGASDAGASDGDGVVGSGVGLGELHPASTAAKTAASPSGGSRRARGGVIGANCGPIG